MKILIDLKVDGDLYIITNNGRFVFSGTDIVDILNRGQEYGEKLEDSGYEVEFSKFFDTMFEYEVRNTSNNVEDLFIDDEDED